MIIKDRRQDTAYFDEAIARHCELYAAHFGQRLRAVYTWGSVHRGEAVRGVSDLDLQVFITDATTAEDDTWYKSAREVLDAQYPGLKGLQRPLPQSLLLAGDTADASTNAKAIARALAFRLHYDATLVAGKDSVKQVVPPTPDAGFARGPFEAVYNLARFAAGRDSQNKTDFALPEEGAHLLRKLARLAVLGGGYLQMAQGQFRSFHGDVVLPSLRASFPEWKDFLDQTQALYIFPSQEFEALLNPYKERLADWVEFVEKQLRQQ